MAEKHKRNPNTTCLICGKKVYKRPSQIKENEGRVFCGQSCYGISCRKEKPCVVCGKPILSSLNRKTCSRKCSNVNRAGITYRGSRPHDKVVTVRILKERIFAQRGKRCERCGYSKYQILQLHHKNRDRKDNSLENLELVCPNCHYEEHLLKIMS